MKQVVLVGGGDAYPSYDAYLAHLKEKKIESVDYFKRGADWKASLQDELGADYDVLMPSMPNKQNARYAEWQIWFEKLIPFLQEGAILVGHSLGGIFLVKYLAENTLPTRISAVVLIAAPYDDESNESLGDFKLPSSLDRFVKQAERVMLYYSSDDFIVPYTELAKYQVAFPSATVRTFSDHGHFFGQPSFPELVADIKSI